VSGSAWEADTLPAELLPLGSELGKRSLALFRRSLAMAPSLLATKRAQVAAFLQLPAARPMPGELRAELAWRGLVAPRQSERPATDSPTGGPP
jgi:hypothetical protein